MSPRCELLDPRRPSLTRWTNKFRCPPCAGGHSTAAGMEQLLAGEAGTYPDFQALVDAVPPPSRMIQDIVVSVAGLRSSMRATTRKAPGPDDWKAAHLLMMGRLWWTCATELWNYALTTGKITLRWTESGVVLIAKASGGHRPLAVASVMWRAGAPSPMNRKLGHLAFTWRPTCAWSRGRTSLDLPRTGSVPEWCRSAPGHPPPL